MTVANSIAKIRRLVNDVGEQDFTDAFIVTTFARAQQKFCRDTLSEVGVVSLLAPPQVSYAGAYAWEEAYVSGSSFFCPFFRTATYSASQAWELEEDQLSQGGYTVTAGGDIAYAEAQHPIPFFPPTDFHAPKGLTWSKRWVEERSMDWVQDVYQDAFTRVGDVVDFMSPMRATRRKAFVTHGVPITTGDATNEATAIDVALEDDTLYLIYVKVPERPDETTDAVTVLKPFRKYVEFLVAERLLRVDGPKKDLQKAKHFEARYEIGVRFVKELMWKLLSDRKIRLHGPRTSALRMARPRFPDHYPAVEV